MPFHLSQIKCLRPCNFLSWIVFRIRQQFHAWTERNGKNTWNCIMWLKRGPSLLHSLSSCRSILNSFLFFCPLGFTVVCGALGTQGSGTALSSELAGVTGGPASGEGLQLSDDDELEVDEELSGGDNENFSLHGRTNKLFPSRHFEFPINMQVNLGLRSYFSESEITKCFQNTKEKRT